MPKDFVNQRNDDFSQKRISARKYGNTDLERNAIEGFTGGTLRGEFNRFLKSIVPANPLTGKSLLSPPSLGTAFDELVIKAQTLSGAIQEIRDAEGNVYINGRLVPGIFQGFRISGGVQTEKFDQKKHRVKTRKQALIEQFLTEKKKELGTKEFVKQLEALKVEAIADAKKALQGVKDIPAGAQLFQIDKGLKPYSGGGSWILLDDEWSTALQKAREFSRIMQFWKDGPDALRPSVGLELKRVFRIESFLVGADRPFNFSTIKILDFGVREDNSIEGRLDANFGFEQFEIFTKDAEQREPESTPNKSDSGVNILSLTIDPNPLTDEPITVP